MTENRIHVGVIGAGNMGRHHIRHLAGLPEAVLSCICDNNQDNLNTQTSTHNVPGYTNIDDFLAHPGLQAVSLAASTSLHYELGKKVLAAGKHLLIEKPIAETPEQAKELIALAKDKNLVLGVGHVERFNPAITALKTCIDQGQFGQILSISCQRMSPFPVQIRDANVILDLAVHDLDLCSYLMPNRPTNIQGYSGKAIISDRSDFADITVTYPNATAHIQVNWVCPIKVRKLQLLGTKGYAEVDFMTPSLTVYPSEYSLEKNDFGSEIARFSEASPQHITIEAQDALQAELRNFVNAIQGYDAICCSGLEGLQALEDALAVLENTPVATS